MEKISPDTLAVWHLLQLAEQGRPIEQTAQWLASQWVAAGHEPEDCLEDCKAIAVRTIELMYNQEKIWYGLLPGGPIADPYGEINEKLVLVDGDEWARLKNLESHANAKKLEEKDMWSWSLWYGEEQISGGYVDAAESVLNLASTVIHRVGVHMATMPDRRDHELWFAWITNDWDASNYVMTYKEAILIRKLDDVIVAHAEWTSSVHGGEIIENSIFQTISDHMAQQGNWWASQIESR